MSESTTNFLQDHFGERLQQNVPLARYTTSRVGGPARWFAQSTSAQQLAQDVRFLWSYDVPFRVLGNGSNVLISDLGWNGLILVNQAKQVEFTEVEGIPALKSESGVGLQTLVRLSIEKGLSGLEWASGIPGTVGGAVYGNAGAYGHDVKEALYLAEILHHEKGILFLTCDQMGYTYRSSSLKKEPGCAVILSATFKLTSSTIKAVSEKADEIASKRRQLLPSGPSFGSTFKNPAGDYAGRLIEAAGLKGTKIGGVQVSQQHANFLVNDGSATATDYYRLIHLIQKEIRDHFAVSLELEIETLGEWLD